MSAYRHGETELKTCAGNLVILRGDEMAELPTDAVNSRVSTLNCPIRPAASEQSNRKLSQKRALTPGHHRRINSLRHNDPGPLTRSFYAALNGKGTRRAEHYTGNCLHQPTQIDPLANKLWGHWQSVTSLVDGAVSTGTDSSRTDPNLLDPSPQR
jgi:hypothetical protein